MVVLLNPWCGLGRRPYMGSFRRRPIYLPHSPGWQWSWVCSMGHMTSIENMNPKSCRRWRQTKGYVRYTWWSQWRYTIIWMKKQPTGKTRDSGWGASFPLCDVPIGQPWITWTLWKQLLLLSLVFFSKFLSSLPGTPFLCAYLHGRHVPPRF